MTRAGIKVNSKHCGVVVGVVVVGSTIVWKATGASLDDTLGGEFLVGLLRERRPLLEE